MGLTNLLTSPLASGLQFLSMLFPIQISKLFMSLKVDKTKWNFNILFIAYVIKIHINNIMTCDTEQNVKMSDEFAAHRCL